MYNRCHPDDEHIDYLMDLCEDVLERYGCELAQDENWCERELMVATCAMYGDQDVCETAVAMGAAAATGVAPLALLLQLVLAGALLVTEFR